MFVFSLSIPMIVLCTFSSPSNAYDFVSLCTFRSLCQFSNITVLIYTMILSAWNSHSSTWPLSLFLPPFHSSFPQPLHTTLPTTSSAFDKTQCVTNTEGFFWPNHLPLRWEGTPDNCVKGHSETVKRMYFRRSLLEKRSIWPLQGS